MKRMLNEQTEAELVRNQSYKSSKDLVSRVDQLEFIYHGLLVPKPAILDFRMQRMQPLLLFVLRKLRASSFAGIRQLFLIIQPHISKDFLAKRRKVLIV